MWRPLDLYDRIVHLRSRASQRLLELGLVVDVAGARVLDLLGEGANDRGLDAREPVLEVDGRDRRLEHGGQHVATSRDPLELVGRNLSRVGKKALPESQLLGHAGATLPRDDVGTDLGEAPFRSICEAVEHRSSDRKLEHAVAEELEPLVRLRALFGPGCVGEDLPETIGRKLVDQTPEFVRAGRGTLNPGAR